MRAVQSTRFGGPEVLDVVDIAEPEASPGPAGLRRLTAGVNYADTHTPWPETSLARPRAPDAWLADACFADGVVGHLSWRRPTP